jgi:isopropylmalate/homocitrate/citramalate synthase
MKTQKDDFKLWSPSPRGHPSSKSFFSERVLHMGALVEATLFGSKVTKRNKKILEYLETYLLLRKKALAKESADPALIEERDKREQLLRREITDEDLQNLIYWARGSRKNPNNTLSQEELNLLYERIKEKLATIEE